MIVPIGIAIVWTLLYLSTYHAAFDATKIYLNYRFLFHNGELWRTITSTFFHIDIVHLFYDLILLFSLTQMASIMGSLAFLGACFQILLLTTTLQLFIYHTIVTRLNSANLSLNWTCSLGASSLMIGLFTAQAQVVDTMEFVLFPGLPIEAGNAPLVAYLLASCLLTEASVLGHFCAGFSGWLLGAGGLRWCTGYWLSCIVLWCLGMVLISVKETTFLSVYLKGIECEHYPPWKKEAMSSAEAREHSIDDRFYIMAIASVREEERATREEQAKTKKKERMERMERRRRGRGGGRGRGRGRKEGESKKEGRAMKKEDDDVEKQSTNGSTKLNQDEFTFFDEEEEDGQHYDEEETKGLLG